MITISDPPFSITATDPSGKVDQILLLMQQLFSEYIAGARIGDVFTTDENDVFTISLSSAGGLEKSASQLKIKLQTDGGIDSTADGIGIKLQTDSGLEVDADGLALLSSSRWFTNVLLMDPDVVDQGDVSEVGSCAYQLNAGGVNEKFTVLFRHTGSSNTTTYTWKTNQNIANNYTIIIEPGAVWVDNGNEVIQIAGPVVAVKQQWIDFDGSGGVYFRTALDNGRTDTVYPEWWGAISDGVTACNAYIEKAAKSFNSFGGRVKFGPGVYKLTGDVTCDQDGVTYEGAGYNFDMWTADEAYTGLDQGTWFWIEDTGMNAFRISGCGIELRHLAFAYDQPTPAEAWSPTNYDYTIKVDGAINNLTGFRIKISDIFILNATYGIQLGTDTDTDSYVGRINLENIYANCFDVGISAERVYDFMTINNVHFGHYWSSNPYVTVYMRENLIAFQSYHADQVKLQNFGAFYGLKGIEFKPADDAGSTAIGTGGFKGTNLTFDNVAYGISVSSNAVVNGEISNFSHVGVAYGASWLTSTNYEVGNQRYNPVGTYYVCTENHTSGVFADDLAAGKWTELTSTGYGIYDVSAGDFRISNIVIGSVKDEGILLGGSGANYKLDNFDINSYNASTTVGTAAINNGSGNTVYIGSQRKVTGAGANAATTPDIFGGAGTYIEDGEGLGPWQTEHTASAVNASTNYSGNMTQDGFICVIAECKTDPTRISVEIETPSGTARVKQVAQYSTALGLYSIYAGGTVPAKSGDGYRVVVTLATGTFDIVVYQIYAEHWPHPYN